ncbi:MarR family transcriptional regulator [Erwinia sp. CPCC 100877]|nr:MarR family transcriptional regulator [Erwinia sp. CPCC 100877]
MEEPTLMEQFQRLQGGLHRYFMKRRREYGPFGNPHRGQGRVLNLLKLKPETTQKELSYLLDMRPQSLGELLSKLEKKGYISREPLESDRRVMVIRLTEAGRAAADTSQEEEATLFNVLSEEEQAFLKEVMNKLLDALEENLPEDEYCHRHGRTNGRASGFHRGGHRGHGEVDPTNFHKRGKYGFGSFDQRFDDEFSDF